jgi:hypothetical protein
MTNPITPPLELVQQWCLEAEEKHQPTVAYSLVGQIATKAARWGADTELEACCQELPSLVNFLRAARRPKPLSLKERALQAWVCVEAGTDDQTAMAVIRRALEALPE